MARLLGCLAKVVGKKGGTGPPLTAESDGRAPPYICAQRLPGPFLALSAEENETGLGGEADASLVR
jgi:hypothetical protein